MQASENLNNFKDHDPLTPFINAVMSNSIREDFYQKRGLEFNNEKYEKIFHEMISHTNFFNDNKFPTLLKLYDDAQVIHDLFEPVRQLGLPINIDLTGGSVRDFVLNKHEEIKDLDIMVSVEFDHMENIRKLCMGFNSEKLLAAGFSLSELQAVNWQDNALNMFENYESRNRSYFQDNNQQYIDAFNTQLNRLMALCINRIPGEKKNFSRGHEGLLVEDFSKVREDNYDCSMANRLTGVVKIKSDSLNYPVDILITHDSKTAFLSNFDFFICQASFSLVNHRHNTKFPKEPTHLISRFSSSNSFFADVLNKKITFSVDDRSQSNLDACITHYERIKEKYSDYEFNVIIQTAKYASGYDEACKNYEYVKSKMWHNDIINNIDMSTKEEKSKLKI